METKKSFKADLRNKQGLFFQIGLLVAIGVTLLAFNYSKPGLTNKIDLSTNVSYDDMDLVPVDRTERKPEEKELPKPQARAIEIVDDITPIDETIDIQSTEGSEEIGVIQIPIAPEPEDNDESVVFYVVEEDPEFPGGKEALMLTIAKSTVYPEAAKELNIQGKVYVSFIVNKLGKVDKVEIARGVDPILDKEAIRVIKSLPDWKPGRQRGKPVNVAFTVPINFQLNYIFEL